MLRERGRVARLAKAMQYTAAIVRTDRANQYGAIATRLPALWIRRSPSLAATERDAGAQTRSVAASRPHKNLLLPLEYD
jgi:hypothetical protein